MPLTEALICRSSGPRCARKGVRQIHRKLLIVRKQGLDQIMQASLALGLYDGELEGLATPPKLRPVLALTLTLTKEAFSLEKALQMYANRERK